MASSIARFGPPTLRRSQHGTDGPAFVEHRWQEGDVEFIVTDFPGRDETHSFSVEMCDARVKRGLATQAPAVEGETERK